MRLAIFWKRFLVLVSLGSAMVGLLGVANAQTGGIYTCTDSAGQRRSSDRPIAQCTDREQRLLGRSGVELQRIAPTLSEVERRESLARERRQQHTEQQAQESRRQDAALLARYPARAAHDAERLHSLAHLEGLQRLTDARLESLLSVQQGLRQELGFYGGAVDKAPARLRAAWQDNVQAVRMQQQLQTTQALDRKKLALRFDEELLRLQPMWSVPAPTVARR